MSLTSARLSGNKRLVAASNNSPVVTRGEKDNEAVAILQTCFVELGFPMPRSTKPSGLFDGVFGQEMDAVVRQFQSKNQLKADGIVGRNTLGKLDEIFDALTSSEGAQIGREMTVPNSGWEIA